MTRQTMEEKTGFKRLSIRFILILIFLTSIMFPISIIMYLVPTYYRQQTTRETIDQTRKNLKAISDTIIIYLSDLQKLAALPYLNPDLRRLILSAEQGNPAPGEQAVMEDTIEGILPNYLKLLREEILSIIIVNDGGTVFHYNRNQNAVYKNSYSIRNAEWYDAAVDAGGQTLFIGAHSPEYFSNSESLQVFSLVRSITYPYGNGAAGVVIVDADMEIFRHAFQDIESDDNTESILLDQGGNILYATTPVSDRLRRSLADRPARVELADEMYNAIYRSVPVGSWTIISMFSEAGIAEQARYIYLIGFSAAGIALILTYTLFWTLMKRIIIMPINRMSSVMKVVASGDLSARCAPSGSREMTSLGTNLNTMVDQLDQLIIRDYQLAISQKKAEYRALQAQVKPHFLYNTLNGLIGLNRLGDRDKLEESIINLTSMMRYSLSDEEMGQTTLEREIQFIREYCDLQKLRFEDKMRVSFDIDEKATDFAIPRLLIQPLVENAVLHNIETSIEPVSILVQTRLSSADSALRVLVADNGSGFDAESAERNGIGIRNVRDRLKMHSPGSSFILDSEPGRGTRVEIIMPTGRTDENAV